MLILSVGLQLTKLKRDHMLTTTLHYKQESSLQIGDEEWPLPGPSVPLLRVRVN